MKVTNKLAQQIIRGGADDWENVPQSRQIVDQERWTTTFLEVFKRLSDGKYFKVFYDRGSTEGQEDTEPFYGDEIEFIEVELKEMKVKKWIRVMENTND